MRPDGTVDAEALAAALARDNIPDLHETSWTSADRPHVAAHFTGAPSNQVMEAFSNSHRPSSEGTFRVGALHTAAIYPVD